jgi:hypothetical protein
MGEAGLGKTSLAATFPKPIFIRAEDGLQSVPSETRPDAFPLIQNTESLWEQLTALRKEDHEYKTVVIDSVTALERLFTQSIVDGDNKRPASINQALGGYGAGMAAVAGLHQRLRKACGFLNDRKGMNVVFIAHADLETVELPDADAFNRYSLRLGKKSIAPYTDDVDVVGQIKLQTFVKGSEGERKKAISDGSRLLIVHAQASCVSKNRYGIEDELFIQKGQNPLSQFIKGL